MENSNIQLSTVDISELAKALYDKNLLIKYLDRLPELQQQADQSNNPSLFLVVYKIMAREPNSPQWRQAYMWLFKAAQSIPLEGQIKASIISELNQYFPNYLDWLEQDFKKNLSTEKLFNLVAWYLNPIFLSNEQIKIYNFKKCYDLIGHAITNNVDNIPETLINLFKDSKGDLKIDYASLVYHTDVKEFINIDDYEKILKTLINNATNEDDKLSYLTDYIKNLGKEVFNITDTDYKALAKTALKYSIFQEELLKFPLNIDPDDIPEIENIIVAIGQVSSELIFIKCSNESQYRDFAIGDKVKKLNELNYWLSLAKTYNEKNAIWNQTIAARQSFSKSSTLKKTVLTLEQNSMPTLLDLIKWRLEHDTNFLVEEISKKNTLIPDIVEKIHQDDQLLLNLASKPNNEQCLSLILERIKILNEQVAANLLYNTVKILCVKKSDLINNQSLLNDVNGYANNLLNKLRNAQSYHEIDFPSTITNIKAYYKITQNSDIVKQLLSILINKVVPTDRDIKSPIFLLKFSQALKLFHVVSKSSKGISQYFAQHYIKLSQEVYRYVYIQANLKPLMLFFRPYLKPLSSIIENDRYLLEILSKDKQKSEDLKFCFFMWDILSSPKKIPGLLQAKDWAMKMRNAKQEDLHISNFFESEIVEYYSHLYEHVLTPNDLPQEILYELGDLFKNILHVCNSGDFFKRGLHAISAKLLMMAALEGSSKAISDLWHIDEFVLPSYFSSEIHEEFRKPFYVAIHIVSEIKFVPIVRQKREKYLSETEQCLKEASMHQSHDVGSKIIKSMVDMFDKKLSTIFLDKINDWKVESEFAFAGFRSKKTQAIDNLFKEDVRDTEWLINLYNESVKWQKQENSSFWHLSARSEAVQKLKYLTACQLFMIYKENDQEKLKNTVDKFIEIIKIKIWEHQGTFGLPTGIKQLLTLAEKRSEIGDFNFLWQAKKIIEERVNLNFCENPFRIFTHATRSDGTNKFYKKFLAECDFTNKDILKNLKTLFNSYTGHNAILHITKGKDIQIKFHK